MEKNFNKDNFQNKNNKKDDKELSRRDFLKKIAILGAGSAILGTAGIFSYFKKRKSESESVIKRESISSNELIRTVPKLDFLYKEIEKVKINNLNMIGKVGIYGVDLEDGKILRTLRFKNIGEAVEEKYNLPKNLILAMIMEETTGVDLLPNARNDGGFGLCHMQGSVAKSFGLKTFENCNELVCNKGHAKKLRKIIESRKMNRKELVELDHRLHPILNLDAAGRMIASYMSGPKLKGRLSDLDPFQMAIARYAGAYNYKNYIKDIIHNIKVLNNKDKINKVRDTFNKINMNLEIDNKKADFDIYIEKMNNINFNYGLESYKNGDKYIPKNSEEVLMVYKNKLI